MRMRKMIGGLLSMAVVFGVVGGASAQDVDKAQNKLLSKRAAEADAYRKLAETIKGLRITSDTLVRDFVTESDVIKSELDTFIKGVRLGKPTWYADLSCEVPAEVTVASVITHLKEMHARSYQGSTIKSTDFVQMKQQIKKDIIKVVGMGAPRPDLPPDLPEGIEAVLTQVTVKMSTPPIPDLWLQIGPQARLMAVRAAELDAQRKLLERIKGIRITSDTLVKDFVTEWDEIRSEAQGYLVGANKVKTYYHHDEPIVEVTYAIPLEQVLTTIKALHTRHYKGNSVKTTDIVNVKKQLKSKTFTATGMGIPPKKYMAAIQKATPVSIPDWAGMKITAVGHGTDSAIDTPQGKLKAARAAELDAKRALIEQIQGMQISSDTLVRDFVTQYDEINAQVDGILMGALVERTEWKDGMAEVTVSVPGMEVWSVFNQQLLIIKRGS